MNKLIIDLQKDIVNPNINIEALLLKSYLIAKKLNLTDFEKWLNHELIGYPADSNLPEYREVSGIPIAFDSDVWQIADENMKRDLTALLYDVLSKYPVRHSISSIVSLISSSKTDIDLISPKKISLGVAFSNIEKIGLRIGKNQFYEILSRIRKFLLDWTIELENNNVLGENFEFSFEEKNRASDAEIKNFIVNIIGNNNQIQQETLNSKQSVKPSS